MSCSIENCNSKIYARGWCRKHYRHVVEGGHAQPHPVKAINCSCGQLLPKQSGSGNLCRDCYFSNWKSNNIESYKAYQKQYNHVNKDKIKQQCQEWHKNNKDKINAYYAMRRKDPTYRLHHNLRSRLYDFLKNTKKDKTTLELTGCTLDELKKHLESQFSLEMNWDNYGSYWSVDHIIPLCSIDSDDKIGLEQLCNYSNLRPIKCDENYSKASEDKKWKKKNPN